MGFRPCGWNLVLVARIRASSLDLGLKAEIWHMGLGFGSLRSERLLCVLPDMVSV